MNRGGGGTLFFPAGIYLTGSIHLKSNITLELEAGATLLFSDNFDDYLPFVEVRHEGVMMKSFQPLIYAVDAENITIKGEGTLDGQGKKWWMEFFRVMIDLKDNGMRDVKVQFSQVQSTLMVPYKVSYDALTYFKSPTGWGAMMNF